LKENKCTPDFPREISSEKLTARADKLNALGSRKEKRFDFNGRLTKVAGTFWLGS